MNNFLASCDGREPLDERSEARILEREAKILEGQYRDRRRITCPPVSMRTRRRFFGSADRSGADRTSDRAGVTQELMARPMGCRMVSRAISVERRWRGRAPPSAQPPARESRQAEVHRSGPSLWGLRPWLARPFQMRRLCRRGP